MSFLKTRQKGTKTTQLVPNLKATDLCDRCPAAASTVVLIGDHELDLLFCGHHTRKHHDALVDQGAKLYTKEA